MDISQEIMERAKDRWTRDLLRKLLETVPAEMVERIREGSCDLDQIRPKIVWPEYVEGTPESFLFGFEPLRKAMTEAGDEAWRQFVWTLKDVEEKPV